jgi:hypothetical protein
MIFSYIGSKASVTTPGSDGFSFSTSFLGSSGSLAFIPDSAGFSSSLNLGYRIGFFADLALGPPKLNSKPFCYEILITSKKAIITSKYFIY